MITMNIHSKRGSKVIFLNPDNGYTHDQELCKKYLTLGGTYTVNHTVVHSSSTEVWLVEVPGVVFNSVMFEDA